MSNTNAYSYFTQDLIHHILDLAQSNQLAQPSPFNDGYNFALYDVMSLIISQAKVFQIDLAELGLANIQAERDTLFKGLAKNKPQPFE